MNLFGLAIRFNKLCILSEFDKFYDVLVIQLLVDVDFIMQEFKGASV